jgi:hypothetical protein
MTANCPSETQRRPPLGSLRRMLLWLSFACGLWVVSSLIPGAWRLLSGGGAVFGTLAIVEKSATGKTKKTKIDWVGLALLIVVIIAIRKGADPLTLLKLLRAPK